MKTKEKVSATICGSLCLRPEGRERERGRRLMKKVAVFLPVPLFSCISSELSFTQDSSIQIKQWFNFEI